MGDSATLGEHTDGSGDGSRNECDAVSLREVECADRIISGFGNGDGVLLCFVFELFELCEGDGGDLCSEG